MSGPQPHFEAAFVASQRQKLLALRTALASAMNLATREEQFVDDAAREQANEFEDRAQDLSIVENDGLLRDDLALRRLSIDRALEKIDEGTYGYSEVSGQPISLDRLQACPEAIRSETEEARHRENLLRRERQGVAT